MELEEGRQVGSLDIAEIDEGDGGYGIERECCRCGFEMTLVLLAWIEESGRSERKRETKNYLAYHTT